MLVLQECDDVFLGLAVGTGIGIDHPQNDNIFPVFAQLFIERLDFGHFFDAETAPGRPEIDKHGFSLVIGQCMGDAVLIFQRKVRSNGIHRFIDSRIFLCGHRFLLLCSNRFFCTGRRNQPGKMAHPACHDHNAHDDEQYAADFGRVTYHVLMLFEEGKHRAGKETYGKERNDKAQSINQNQQIPSGLRACGSCHHQHACQGRADTGGPGEGKAKSHDQGSQRIHGQLVQPQRKTFFAGQNGQHAEYAQLIQTKEQYDQTAYDVKHRFISAEKLSRSRKAKSQQKEGKTDTQYEEHRVAQNDTAMVQGFTVCACFSSAAGQITQIQRKKREHTGRKEAEKALQKNGHGGNGLSKGKSHK